MVAVCTQQFKFNQKNNKMKKIEASDIFVITSFFIIAVAYLKCDSVVMKIIGLTLAGLLTLQYIKKLIS